VWYSENLAASYDAEGSRDNRGDRRTTPRSFLSSIDPVRRKTMKRSLLNVCRVVLAGLTGGLLLSAATRPAAAQTALLAPGAIATPLNRELTALDRYVAKPDSSYEWRVLGKRDTPAGTAYVIDLTSQTWLTADEVNRPVWKHWLTVVRPKNATANKALLFIAGGSNEGGPPQKLDERLAQIAMATESVVAELRMIPNQPLVFHHDGVHLGSISQDGRRALACAFADGQVGRSCDGYDTDPVRTG
jgi:PhoPQ-activated pathogenicity-related protein